MCNCEISLGNCLVVEVGYRLGSHTEVRGAVDVHHGKGEVKPYQLLVAGFFIWDEEGDIWDVIHPHSQPHVRIIQVYL